MGKLAKGAWPTMVTAFHDDGSLDFKGNAQITDYLIKSGANGLFTVCMSSEMHFLDAQQKKDLAKCVLDAAGGRVQVIASGHTSADINAAIDELGAVAETGVDAIVLVTNCLAGMDDGIDVFEKNLNTILKAFPDTRFAAYECPTPFKRVLADDEVKLLADSGRIEFLKDVSVDVARYERRAKIVKGSPLMLFNANTQTYLKSLQLGYDGYSGPMCNYHVDMFRWMYENFEQEPEKAAKLQDWMTHMYTTCIPTYPMSAKYHMSIDGDVDIGVMSFMKDVTLFTEEAADYMAEVRKSEKEMREYLGIL